jgi:hypothetical protein
MERKSEEYGLDIAHSLFDALCTRMPGLSLALVDGYGRVVASNDRPTLKPLSIEESYRICQQATSDVAPLAPEPLW